MSKSIPGVRMPTYSLVWCFSTKLRFEAEIILCSTQQDPVQEQGHGRTHSELVLVLIHIQFSGILTLVSLTTYYRASLYPLSLPDSSFMTGSVTISYCAVHNSDIQYSQVISTVTMKLLHVNHCGVIKNTIFHVDRIIHQPTYFCSFPNVYTCNAYRACLHFKVGSKQ